MTTHAQWEGAGESRKPRLQQFLLRGFMDAVGSDIGIASATSASFLSEDLTNGFLRIGHISSARSSVSLICWSGQLSCETQRGEEMNI